ncbi:MAG: hypothetical protein AAF203_07080 [Pseudomonadota bacterium]
MKAIIKYSVYMIIALTFAACGGGGGSAPATPQDGDPGAASPQTDGTLWSIRASSSISAPDDIDGLWESSQESVREDSKTDGQVREGVRIAIDGDTLIMSRRCTYTSNNEVLIAEAEATIRVNNDGFIIVEGEEKETRGSGTRACVSWARSTNGQTIGVDIFDGRMEISIANPQNYRKIAN